MTIKLGKHFNPLRIDDVFGILNRVLWNKFIVNFYHMNRINCTLLNEPKYVNFFPKLCVHLKILEDSKG